MTVVARTVAAALVALGCLLPGSASAAAQAAPVRAHVTTYQVTVESAGPLGSDSRESVITAAVAGLGLGAVIAFWQSRRHRRKGPPSDEAGDER